MARKYRATMHNGRTHTSSGKSTGEVFSAKHNDRNYTAKNLNPEPERKNLYFIMDTDGTIISHPKVTFEEHEKRIYEQLFSDVLNAQNERHRKAGHASRVRTMDEVRTSPKTAPEETILQLGTREEYADPNLFVKAVNMWCSRMHAAYGSNWRLLDGAIHFDESTPHCHIRAVWVADSTISQSGALKALHFQAPDPNKPNDRYNNPKMSFTKASRDIWIDAAKEYGIGIEETPETPGKATLTKEEFIKEKVRAETAKLTAEKADLQEQVHELTIETNRLKSIIKRFKAMLNPIEHLVKKLANIMLSPNKSVLDDVLLDSKTADSIESLRQLEEEQI